MTAFLLTIIVVLVCVVAALAERLRCEKAISDEFARQWRARGDLLIVERRTNAGLSLELARRGRS